jgi:hypothetical protein
MIITIVCKESLYSDGHQFYQYHQNKQSPLILTELIEHKKDHIICCYMTKEDVVFDVGGVVYTWITLLPYRG